MNNKVVELVTEKANAQSSAISSQWGYGKLRELQANEGSIIIALAREADVNKRIVLANEELASAKEFVAQLQRAMKELSAFSTKSSQASSSSSGLLSVVFIYCCHFH